MRRAAVISGAVLTGAFALAGCGGGSSTPGVARVATTTSTAASPSATGGTHATGLLAYSACMRSHGVPSFPDPSSKGGIPKEAVISASREVGNSKFEAADRACRRLLPAGESLSGRPTQTVTPQDEQYYLKAAACMRSHGITSFPDPSFSGGQVEFPMLEHIVDTHSSQFTNAYHICQKLIPAGLPDSIPSGG